MGNSHDLPALSCVLAKAWERDPLIRALQCLYTAVSAADAEKWLHLSPWSADEEDGWSEATPLAQKCSQIAHCNGALRASKTQVASKLAMGSK